MAQDDRPWDEVAAELVANGVDADVAAEMAVDAVMAREPVQAPRGLFWAAGFCGGEGGCEGFCGGCSCNPRRGE